jgi:hypothetical protein
MRRYYFSFIFILIGHFSLLAESSLHVLDPRSWGGIWAGEISEATLAIEPQGVFMKYDLYMTFSSQNTPVGPDDSLEVEFFFNLPKEAIVCDSWLWIEDYISYGIIMDADSASRTYEGIVNRRTDPSILFKRSATEYELRIFPITQNDPRKVKITFLLPMEWAGDLVMANLPLKEFLPWLSASTMDLILPDSSIFLQPQIMENPAMTFTHAYDSIFGNHLKTQINVSNAEFNLTFGYDSPMENGVYVSYFNTQPDEGYYQMALAPSAYIDSFASEKILFLLDYNHNNGDDFRDQFKEIIQEIMGPEDSLNLILKSTNGTVLASPHWLAADSSLIDSLFATTTFTLSPHPSMLSLLNSAHQFMSQHNNEGSIVLFSNNDSYNSSASALQFLSGVNINPALPITVVNYQHRDPIIQWDSNQRRYLWGNDYLFTLLADRTGGSYRSLFRSQQSMYNSLRKAVLSATGQFDVMDIYTGTQGGFCYFRHDISRFSYHQPVREAFLQTGRYYGNLPFEIDFFGVYNEEILFFDVELNPAEMNYGGPGVRKAWAAQEIQSMEGTGISYAVRKEIIKQSIDARVLSLYTAFLCLEDSVQLGLITNNDGIPVGSDLLEENEEDIQVYPNPFHDRINIKIENLSLGSFVELQLFDLQGKMVHEFEPEEKEIVDGKIELEWSGLHLPPGIYALVMKNGVERQAVKIVKR